MVGLISRVCKGAIVLAAVFLAARRLATVGDFVAYLSQHGRCTP